VPGLAFASTGQLICADGEGGERRERRISRNQAAAGQIRRLLVLGDGMITTEATAWCHGVGVALVVCDRDAAQLGHLPSATPARQLICR
jgi:hypothetical protein